MNPNSLNLNTRGRKTSATISINETSKKLEQQGRAVYKFGLGQSPFPVPNCVVESLRENAFQKDYLSPQGFLPLREAVSQFYQTQHDIQVDPNFVMIGPGSKELMFILQLAFYGDIIVTSPCWVSYVPQAQIIGRSIRVLLTTFESRWRIQADDLYKLCEEDPLRPRLLILNYPGNPEGLSYTQQELQEIVAVARKYNIIVLSDEIYSLLTFDGSYTSIAKYYPEGTIISSGLSKWCGAGGWRLGTFCFPAEFGQLLKSMTSIASETFTSVSAPIQHAAIRAFTIDKEIELYLEHSRKILHKIALYCCEQLNNAGIKVWEPQGGFYILFDLSHLRKNFIKRELFSAEQICLKLLEEAGVAVLPGTDFQRDEQELSIRLAFVDFDGATALQKSQGREELDDLFLKQNCPKIVDGIQALVSWCTEQEKQ